MSYGLRHWWHIILYTAQAKLKSESNRNYFGYLWWVLDPLLYMAIFYVVFAVLLEKRTADFVTFLLVGLTFFRWFAGSVSNAQRAIMSNKGIMQQVVLPKIIFPLSETLAAFYRFSFILALLLIYLCIRGYWPDIYWLALPLVMLMQVLLVVGAALIVAAVVPVLPDLRYLIDNLLTMTLFLSGIFYQGSDLAPEKQSWFYLNPISRLLESYRDILIFDQWPKPAFIWYPGIFGSVMVLIGWFIISRLDRHYPKIVRTV